MLSWVSGVHTFKTERLLSDVGRQRNFLNSLFGLLLYSWPFGLKCLTISLVVMFVKQYDKIAS